MLVKQSIVVLLASLVFTACGNSIFSDYANRLGGALDSGGDSSHTNPMVFKIKTSQSDEVYHLPLPAGFNYDFSVDWGDESPFSEVTSFDDVDASHTYSVAGTYTIKLSGKVQAFSQTAKAGACIITEVVDLGTVDWRSLETAFMGCPNLVSVKGGDLSKVRTTRGMFYLSSQVEPQTSSWNISKVRDMEGMFAFAKKANPDTSNWDVSKVEVFKSMFMGAETANPDTGLWNTKSAKDMSWMFMGAKAANPNVAGWKLSKVTDIQSIFNEAPLANPDVTEWDVSKVTNLSGVFRLAVSAQPDVSKWEVGNVTTMESLFGGATLANPDLSKWNFAEVRDMDNLVNLTSITSENYSKLLVRVNETTLQSRVVLRAGYVKYQLFAQPAREELVSSKGWTIYDRGLENY